MPRFSLRLREVGLSIFEANVGSRSESLKETAFLSKPVQHAAIFYLSPCEVGDERTEPKLSFFVIVIRSSKAPAHLHTIIANVIVIVTHGPRAFPRNEPAPSGECVYSPECETLFTKN